MTDSDFVDLYFDLSMMINKSCYVLLCCSVEASFTKDTNVKVCKCVCLKRK